MIGGSYLYQITLPIPTKLQHTFRGFEENNFFYNSPLYAVQQAKFMTGH